MPAPVPSVSVVPSSGTVPFLATATAGYTGGDGSGVTYTFDWGDGAITAAQSSNVATHTYSTSGGFTVAMTVTNTGVVAITHGQQMNASNTGIAFAGLTTGDLTTTVGTTYNTPGQVVTNKRFTGPVNITANNVTLRNCQVETNGASTQAINITGTNALIENCTVVPQGATSAYMGIHVAASGATIRRCDISKCENNMTIEADSCLVEYSYLHDSSNASNPTGHRDCIEVYAGNDVTLRMNRLVHPPGETAVVNIAPWFGSTNVLRCQMLDNFMDGGNMIVLVDLQSTGLIQQTKVLRNKMGGHTDPAVIGRYAALNNADGRAITQTQTAQDAAPNSIQWPTTGPDVNTWDECSDLTPNLTGQVISPS